MSANVSKKEIPALESWSLHRQTSRATAPLIPKLLPPRADRIAAGIVSLGYEKENRQETHIHSARRFGRSGGAGRRRSHAPADPEAEFDNRLRRSSLAISFGGSGKEPSRMQVHIKSEATPIPEGLSRTIDKYNKIILPYNAPSGGKEER